MQNTTETRTADYYSPVCDFELIEAFRQVAPRAEGTMDDDEAIERRAIDLIAKAESAVSNLDAYDYADLDDAARAYLEA